MQKLSDEQIHNLALIIELNGLVVLRCDGYDVSLMNIGLYGNSCGGAHVMIDNCMNVHWLLGGHSQSKFLKPVTDDTPSWMKGWKYQPYFDNAKNALEHINAASDDVELLLTQNSNQWRHKAVC